MKLSATQTATLKRIVVEFDAFDSNERTRWGKEFVGYVDMSDTNYRTLHRLADLGLIEFKGIASTTSVQRRGAFGRTAGMGTKNVSSVQLLARPTETGRKAI